MWYPINGAPPSGAGVQPREMEEPVVLVMARVGGAGGTPLFRLTENFRVAGLNSGFLD
jgi:hypothetical protein